MSSDLRIADITQWYAPQSGGIRTYLHAKADYAARTSTPHGLIVTAARNQDTNLASSRVIAVRGRTPIERWGYRIAVNARAVLAALDALEPNLVVVHDALAFPKSVARWTRTHEAALVIACHSDLAAAVAGLPRPVRSAGAPVLARVQARALRTGDVVMVASDATRTRIASRTPVPIVVSSLGVNLEEFVGARPSLELRASLAGAGQTLLVYVGRLSSDKRTELLADMLAALPERFVLTIAGSGAANGRIVRRARRLGIRHRLAMLGHIANRARIATLLATADCFVHPNPNEPFGLAPLEALAAGCRVVLPARAGAADILASHGAILTGPGSADALAGGVLRALEHPRPEADLSDLRWERTFEREWALYRELRP